MALSRRRGRTADGAHTVQVAPHAASPCACGCACCGHLALCACCGHLALCACSGHLASAQWRQWNVPGTALACRPTRTRDCSMGPRDILEIAAAHGSGGGHTHSRHSSRRPASWSHSLPSAARVVHSRVHPVTAHSTAPTPLPLHSPSPQRLIARAPRGSQREGRARLSMREARAPGTHNKSHSSHRSQNLQKESKKPCAPHSWADASLIGD